MVVAREDVNRPRGDLVVDAAGQVSQRGLATKVRRSDLVPDHVVGDERIHALHVPCHERLAEPSGDCLVLNASHVLLLPFVPNPGRSEVGRNDRLRRDFRVVHP